MKSWKKSNKKIHARQGVKKQAYLHFDSGNIQYVLACVCDTCGGGKKRKGNYTVLTFSRIICLSLKVWKIEGRQKKKKKKRWTELECVYMCVRERVKESEMMMHVCVEPGEGFEQVLSFDLVSVEAKLT